MRRLLPILCLLLGLTSWTSAAQDVRGGQDRDARIEASRVRWDAMSPERRAEMRRRFEELKSLPADEREALRRGAEHLRKIRERVRRSLDAEARLALESMPREKREQLLREMAAEEARQFTQRVLARMPAEWRAKVDAAGTPEARGAVFEEFKDAMEDRWRNRRESSDGPSGRGGPDGHRSHDRGDFMKLMAHKLREKLRETIAEKGGQLPAGVTEKQITDLEALDDELFLQAAHRLFESHPDFFPPRGRGPGAGSRGRGSDARHQLHSALRNDPAVYIELAGLTPEVRATEIMRRQRTKVLSILRDSGLVDADKLTELETLDDASLLDNVRSIVCERPWGRSRGRGSWQRGGRRRGERGGDHSRDRERHGDRPNPDATEEGERPRSRRRGERGERGDRSERGEHPDRGSLSAGGDQD